MAFDAGQVSATLTLDRTPFQLSLAQARKSATDFARQTYEATLDVKGSAKTIGELDAVDEKADSLDGRNVDLKVDEDGSAGLRLRSLSEGFKGLASNIRATSTVLAASSIPFAIAGIGAGIPTIATLGASLGGLALNLGKAATGFGLVGAAAGGGALAGLKAYSSLISSTLSDSRELWEEENEKAVKALEKQRYEILENAQGFGAWNNQLNTSLLGFTHLQAAVGSKVFPQLTKELDAWTGIMREMRPFIAQTAGDIVRIGIGFTRWFRTAGDGKILRTTVGFLSVSAERAAKALSLIAQIGVSAFQPLIPLASGLQKTVLGILNTTNEWVQSAEGQSKLGQIYQGLWNDAKRLWSVVRDLGISVGQFFNLLDRTGIADQASRGLKTFAHWLREATQRGGRLESFLRDARALMPFVANAAVAVASAVGQIAEKVISARQAGHRLTILQGIFRGIGNAAKPLKNLVIGTFRALGPVIRDLLPPLARFFGTFAGSSGPLVTFINTLTRVLKTFNKLPQPVRETAAKLLALKVILGGLGVGAVVGPMGRFASNMVLANGAARKLAGKSALLGVAGGLAGIGAVIAGGIGLGVLFYGLKRAYDKNEEFRKSVDNLRDAAIKAFNRISNAATEKLLPAIRKLADKGAKALLDIFDLTDKDKTRIQNQGRSATAQYGLGIRQGTKKQTGEGSPGYEFGFKVGMTINRGLRGGLDGGGKGGKKGGADNPIGNWIRRTIPGAAWIDDNVADPFVGDVFTGMGKAFSKAKWSKRLHGWMVNPLGKAFKNFAPTWRSFGGQVVRAVLKGLLGVDVKPAFDKLAKKIREGFKGAMPDWKNMGKNAAKGYLEGFKKGGLVGGLVGAVSNARDAVKKWQKERSPAKLWMEQGKNAALGYVQAFGKHIGGVIDPMRRTFDATRQLGPGDPGYLDDGFRKNSRQSPGRGKWGYVQAEDGSWVYNPELYREEQRRNASRRTSGGMGLDPFERRRYLEDLQRKRDRGTDRERFDAYGRRDADKMRQMANDTGSGPFGRWAALLQKIQRPGRGGYDIGGDIDPKEYPRAIVQALKADGWFVRGGSIFHPDTPRNYDFNGTRPGRGGRHPIDEDGMRRVMREHRSESGRQRSSGDSIDYDRLAHAIVGAMQSGLPGFIDNSMGGYFNHRNAAGADPR